MQAILTELGVDTARPKAVSDVRVQTTTPVCPFLRSIAPVLSAP